MGGLGRRIERLEAGLKQSVAGSGASARLWERYFHAHENARRELEGLEPLPDLPYTEEDRENDQRTLEETIPAYRGSGGWKTEESRAFLDQWERNLIERLYRKD